MAVMCRTCGRNPAVGKDYRWGLPQGYPEVFLHCRDCFLLSDAELLVALRRKERRQNKPKKEVKG